MHKKKQNNIFIAITCFLYFIFEIMFILTEHNNRNSGVDNVINTPTRVILHYHKYNTKIYMELNIELIIYMNQSGVQIII